MRAVASYYASIAAQFLREMTRFGYLAGPD